MITIHQRHRRTDGQTDGRHAIPIPRICTKVHCAVKNAHLSQWRGLNPPLPNPSRSGYATAFSARVPAFSRYCYSHYLFRRIQRPRLTTNSEAWCIELTATLPVILVRSGLCVRYTDSRLRSTAGGNYCMTPMRWPTSDNLHPIHTTLFLPPIRTTISSQIHTTLLFKRSVV